MPHLLGNVEIFKYLHIEILKCQIFAFIEILKYLKLLPHLLDNVEVSEPGEVGVCVEEAG